MLPNNRQDQSIRSDPTAHIPDGRSANEARFIDFPNNPDMYGNIDPYEKPNQTNNSLECQRPQPNIGKFAPPGQFPTGFSPNAPINGVDGNGSLVMRGTGNTLRNGPVIHGDVDMMIANGVIPPNRPPNYPYGYDDDVDPFFSGGGLPRPGNRPNRMNGPPFPGPQFHGGPRMGGSPGFGGF